MKNQKTYMPNDPGDIIGEEHWAKRGEIDLFLFRRYSPIARAENPEKPVLFLVHGSSFRRERHMISKYPNKAITH